MSALPRPEVLGADDGERVRELIERRNIEPVEALLPAARTAIRRYFRFEIEGLDRIPAKGPVLIVSNHSGGGWSPDAAAFVVEFLSHFGTDRPLHFLGHSALVRSPVVGSVLSRFGVLPASRDIAVEALGRGACVMVFPGGEVELHRPFYARDEIRFQGRTGFLSLAGEADVPLVPLVMSGGQSTFLPVADGRWLARVTGFRRLTGIKTLPVAAGIPWGFTVGNLLGWIPLPATIRARVLDPIDVSQFDDLEHAYEQVTASMQTELRHLSRR